MRVRGLAAELEACFDPFASSLPQTNHFLEGLSREAHSLEASEPLAVGRSLQWPKQVSTSGDAGSLPRPQHLNSGSVQGQVNLHQGQVLRFLQHRGPRRKVCTCGQLEQEPPQGQASDKLAPSWCCKNLSVRCEVCRTVWAACTYKVKSWASLHADLASSLHRESAASMLSSAVLLLLDQAQ